MIGKETIVSVINVFITGLLAITAFVTLSAASYSLLITGGFLDFLVGLAVGCACILLLTSHLNQPIVRCPSKKE